MSPSRLDRRAFIQCSATAAVSLSFAACAVESNPFRFFTASEAHLLETVCNQIIPADEDPGAAWAGAVQYIDTQLMGFFQTQQSLYRQGLVGVEETSLALFGASPTTSSGSRFLELPFEQQTEVMVALEKNNAPGETWKRVSSSQFFWMVIEHTMQGFYGSPRHGGNREGASFRMLKIPHPPVRGRHVYDIRTALSDTTS